MHTCIYTHTYDTYCNCCVWAVGQLGRMHYCSDPLVHFETECTGIDNFKKQRLWLNAPAHFDWIGRAVASVT